MYVTILSSLMKGREKMEKENIIYFLTLRIQKGQETRIDLSQMRVSQGFNPISLEDLDAFTLNFTKDELLKEIDNDNLAGEYINGTLCITDNQNHRPLPVLTKDYVGDFNIFNYITVNIHNKNLMSNLNNKYQNLMMNDIVKEKFKNAIHEENIDGIFEGIRELEYIHQRELVCYIIDSLSKKQDQGKERKLDKAA